MKTAEQSAKEPEDNRRDGRLLLERLLTVKDVMEILQVDRTWIYSRTCRTSRKQIPFKKIGKYIRFSPQELSTWLQEQKPCDSDG